MMEVRSRRLCDGSRRVTTSHADGDDFGACGEVCLFTSRRSHQDLFCGSEKNFTALTEIFPIDRLAIHASECKYLPSTGKIGIHKTQVSRHQSANCTIKKKWSQHSVIHQLEFHVEDEWSPALSTPPA